MKDEQPKEMVLEGLEETREYRVTRFGDNIKITEMLFEFKIGGKWIDGRTFDIPLSVIEKIHEAWGKKKEITEKEVTLLLAAFNGFEWFDNKKMREFIKTWLSKLGITVKPEESGGEG